MLVRPSSSRRSLLSLRARQMRSAPTAPEAELFRLIGAGKLGVVFRRQVVVGNRFVVDLLAPAIQLAVEVDGSWHSRRLRADARRDDKLRRLGYHILRLEAALVMHRPEAAVALVQAAVERLR